MPMLQHHDTMRWAEVTSQEHSSSAPTIKNHSVTHFNGYLFCFGGYDGRRNHMTLLLYSIAEQRWIRPHHQALEEQHPPDFRGGDPSIVVQGTPPPGRNGHSATLAVDDDETAKIVIIGGWLGTGPLAASDMHVLDVSAGGRQLRWYQPAVKGVPPGPCNMHSADYVKHRREVYVFRGGNGREYLNDLHALNVDTLVWREVQTTGEVPQPRANHSSAMLEETGELCLFGGWNGGERLNDIHILDTYTSTWTRPRVGGVLPHPRAGMTLTALRGRLMLFGGSGTSAKCFNDLQILDRQEMVWLDVSQADSANSKNAQAEDTIDSPAFRFGGDFMYPQNHNRDTQESSGEDQGGMYTSSNNESQNAASYSDDNPADSPQHSSYSTIPRGADWQSRDMAGQLNRTAAGVRTMHVSPNPNDEDVVPTVLLQGKGPGRRAGHTATVVNRKIYVFGGSCGSDYLNDFFVLDTDPPPRASVTEPTSLQLMERRLCHFFNDEEFSDVTFVVQGHKVYGHRMVLSVVSDCFRAMFTTGFRESEAMEIEIQDCTHEAFLSVMEYIYTGSLPKSLLHSIMGNNGNRNQLQPQQVDRLVDLLELADRFFVDHLKQVCEALLQNAVNADSVEYLLQVSHKTNAIQLQTICEHFLRNLEDSAAG